MGSLIKLFDRQSRVWNLGKVLSGFVAHPNSNDATKVRTKVDEVKRPGSPYTLFMQSRLPTLRQQNSHLQPTQIFKLASSMWKTESEFTKLQYREEFNRKMEEYRRNVKEVPRRPSPPFAQFFGEINNSLQDKYPDGGERMKKASELWKNLSVVEKQRYKSSYKSKWNLFADNLSEEDNNLIQERKETLYAKRQQRDIRRYGKHALKERPTPHKPMSYNIFVQEKAGEVTDKKNLMKILGEQWRNMSVSEKEVYKERASNAVKTYRKDLEDWQEKYDRSLKK